MRGLPLHFLLFLALKLSFCYAHGCNRHPGGILRSKANAPRFFSSHEHGFLVSFDAENITHKLPGKDNLLFTNKCFAVV